ncbi:hypothetical protein AB9F46_23690 [Rhizobium leguminosarum]|uniref:hypothetical protein n=1 Tax=Rhizobium leguminosarum TaxID=384 RepID=UPI003F9DB9DC
MPYLAISKFRILTIAVALSGCGVGAFDIPSDDRGPTVRSIVDRVTCELVDMVKDGPTKRETLLLGDYQVGVTLSLSVNDTGELSPSLNFPVRSTLAWNAGLKLSQSRERNYTQNLFYSMKSLQSQWRSANETPLAPGEKAFGACPEKDTNLAGTLGLRETVDLALTAPYRNLAGEFGGFVNFVVERNVNSVGPTWTLQHFSGPGNLGMLSHVNTDKVTFAFVQGDGTNDIDATRASNVRIRDLLLQLYINERGGL